MKLILGWNKAMKLTKILTIRANLRCLSGLHIGGGDTEMHIGGIDNAVVRNPLTGRPYIPGSSLKGKIRSLLEWRTGIDIMQSDLLSYRDYQPSKGNTDLLTLLKLFGTGGSDKLTDAESYELGPTRLSFWDCDFKDEWIRSVEDANELPTEVKSENMINRLNGNVTPRYTERVIAGALFDFRLSVKVIDDEEKTLLPTVLAGLKLLELDSLGGSGSRGYGKIAFEGLTIDGQDRQADFAKLDPFKTQTK